MQLGWVNFSKKDKSNAISIIQTLEGPRVLDELGFGVLRDAFANDFFPGTSTLHTRPKYLYLISYLLYEYQQKCATGKIPYIANNSSFINFVESEIDKEEWRTKEILMKNGGTEEKGVIGSSSKKRSDWVERTPIIIYWTGLRMYDFIKSPKESNSISYSELLSYFYSLSHNKYEEENTATEKNSDIVNDDNAGEKNFFPVKKGLFSPNWRENVSIELTPKEASDLKQCIIECDSSKNSLFAIILKENLLTNVPVDMNFESFVATIRDRSEVPQTIKTKLEYACELNDFYYIVILRYYYLLSENVFKERWMSEKKKIKKICNAFNPDEIFQEMKIKNKTRLLKFLRDIKKELLIASDNGCYDEVDKLITEREVGIKRGREKIGHRERYNENELEKIKVVKYDYRFFVAKRYIQDIQKGLNIHVKS